MVDVRFELTTNDPWSCRRRHLLKASLVVDRWATGKRLTNRLPKLSLITSVPFRTERKVKTVRSSCYNDNGPYVYTQSTYL